MKRTEKERKSLLELKLELVICVITAVIVIIALVFACKMVKQQEKFYNNELTPPNAVTIVDLPELTNDLK